MPRIGEQVRRADGTTATVVGLGVVPGAANMWDLTVSHVHTFAVGVGAYVVHNCGSQGNADHAGPGDPNQFVKTVDGTPIYKGQAIDETTRNSPGWQQVGTPKSNLNWSQGFSRFVRETFGDSMSDWDYVYDDYTDPQGQTVQNHYWRNIMRGLEFHHH